MKSRSSVAAIFICLLLGCAGHKRIALPSYTDFVSLRQQSLSKGVFEIYGRYDAALSGKTIRSTFNLLLDPGKSAYMEILSPASRLTHAVSLNNSDISLLWTEDTSYVEEKASAQTLNAIAGIPVMPDDLLYLLAGYGLNFEVWKMEKVNKDGWDLSRDIYRAQLTMQDELSSLTISSAGNPSLVVRYDEYTTFDNRSLPSRIRFEVPARNLKIELRLLKYEPRDEPATPDLFALKLPDNAHRLPLHEIYHGKPLLFQR